MKYVILKFEINLRDEYILKDDKPLDNKYFDTYEEARRYAIDHSQGLKRNESYEIMEQQQEA